MATNIVQHRRGTTAEWQLSTVIPATGELVVEECIDGTRRCKIGDGQHTFADLAYVDAVATNAVDVLTAKVNNDVFGLQTNLAKVQLEVSGVKKEVKNLVQPSIDHLDTQYSAKLAALEGQQQADYDELSKAIGDGLDGLENDFKSELASTAAGLTRKITTESNNLKSDYEVKIQKATTDLQQELLTAKDEQRQDLEKVEEDIRIKLGLVQNSVNSSIDQLSRNDAVISQIQAELAAIRELGVGSGDDTLQGRVAALEAKADLLNTSDVAVITKLYALDTAVSRLVKRLDDLKAQHSKEQEALADNFLAVKNFLKEADAEVLEKVTEDLSQVRGQIAQIVTNDVELYKSFVAAKADTSTKLENLRTTIESTVSDFDGRLAETLTTANTTAEEYTNEAVQKLADEVAQTTDALADDIDNIRIYNSNTASATAYAHQQLMNAIDDNHKTVLQQVDDVKETIASNKVNADEALLKVEDDVEKLQLDLASTAATVDGLDTSIKLQANQIGALIAAGTEVPSANPDNQELVDIRRSYDGTVHSSAGNAVRAVGSKVHELETGLSQYINTNAVNGLRYDTEGEVGLHQPYMLYLTAGGEILENSGVQIIGGAGGGTGGGSGTASSLKINYITPQAAIFKKSDKAFLRFNFEGTDSAGDIISRADATWKVNGITVAQGAVYSGENLFEITEYFSTSTITVLLVVTDANGSVATKTWTAQQVDISLTSNFDDKKYYTAGRAVTFNFVPTGAVEKEMVFKFDNEELRKPIAANKSGSEDYYTLPAKPHGAYLLEAYFEASFDGRTEPSNKIYKDIIYYDPNVATPIIGVAQQKLSVDQYSTTNIAYTVYDPQNDVPTVKIQVDGTLVDTVSVNQNKAYGDTPTAVYSYIAAEPGVHEIKLICGSVEKRIEVVVASIGVKIEPVTDGLAFDFNPAGKSNSSPDRLWNDGDVHMSVSKNFDWVNGGYIPDDPDGPCFCIKAGSSAVIDYKLFASENDAKVNGKEFKLVFKTKNVAAPDAVFLSCVNNTTETNHIGIEMGVHSAAVYAKSGKLDLAYSEDDVIEFEFNISKASEAVTMVMGYEDGVPSRPMIYDETHDFVQTNEQTITLGSPYCDTYIYRFKVYEMSLSSASILQNFIADARTTDEMLARYNRNQILDENNKLTAEVLAEKCPGLRVYKISAPRFTTSKKDQVGETTIQQIYRGKDATKYDNWIAKHAWHSGQGTSSDNYGAAGRNLDFILNLSYVKKPGDAKPVSITLSDGTPVDTVSLTASSIPVDYLNVKVNIASSNNLTNALLAKRYNQFNPYRRPFVREDKSIIDNIKDTMEFYNCAIFVQETGSDAERKEFNDNDWHFYAIGNVGDSKKTDNTRLTDPDDPYECCVEIMDVDLPLSAFPRNTMVNAVTQKDGVITNTWVKDENRDILYEARYEKTSDKEIDLNKTYYIELDGKIVNAMEYSLVKVDVYTYATEENLALGLLFEHIGGDQYAQAEGPLDLKKTYYIKVEDKDDNGISTGTFSFIDAMDHTSKFVKQYTYATQENIGRLYEISYFKTEDDPVNLNKTYFVDILENDDFSEDYTYGWRYISNDEEGSDAVVHCKQAWKSFYRFVTTTSDEEFKQYFDKYFVKDSALYYYLFTERYCMVDNRAKNTFWHYGKTGGTYTEDIEIKNDNGDVLFSATAGEPIRKWDLCWDYDNDTALGLNNFGIQLYRYGLEDIDVDDSGEEVFRQSDSTFFRRIRELFADELMSMYQTLESSNAWLAEALIEEADNWQSQFPEELWRFDIERKYIRTYTSSFKDGAGDTQFLENMANGRMKYHRRQWERNQEQYMASKYQTTLALGDANHANFRVAKFTADEKKNLKVPPSYSFTLTPYSHIYLNVKYGGASPISVRANPNEPTVVPYSAAAADIINVGSAAAIKDFGNLYAIYPSTVSVQNASRITSLKIGTNEPSDYYNKAFKAFTSGANNLLEELDITNTGYNESLKLGALTNLKILRAAGSAVPGVTFADGGKLEEAELPAIGAITLKNLKYLTNDKFKLDSYNNVTELTVVGCPEIDQFALLTSCLEVPKIVLSKVKLDNIHFGNQKYSDFAAMVFDRVGVDTGKTHAQLTGSVHFKDDELTGEQFNEVHGRYPNLTITYDKLTSVIKVMKADNSTVQYETAIENAGDCQDPRTAENWEVPVKTADEEFSYEWFGWSEDKDVLVNYEHLGSAEAKEAEDADRIKYFETCLKHVEGDRVLYPVFKANRNECTVYFVNPTDGNAVLYSTTVKYGQAATYKGATPVKCDGASASLYEFVGWYPDTTNCITEPGTQFEAQFAIKDQNYMGSDRVETDDGDRLPGYTFGWSDISSYNLSEGTRTMSISGVSNKFNSAVRIPEKLTKLATDYTITSIGGFKGYEALVLLELPNTIEELQNECFKQCVGLYELHLPDGLLTIGANAFNECTNLRKINIPASVNSIGSAPFIQCTELISFDVDNDDPTATYRTIANGKILIDKSGKLIQGLRGSTLTAETEGVTRLSEYCFNYGTMEAVIIPNGITEIPSNAFSRCSSLKTVTLPASIEHLRGTCFSWCTNLETVNLPDGLKTIGTYVFNECKLQTVTIPASVDSVLERAFGTSASGPFSLKAVEFASGRLDKDGNQYVPDIAPKAFLNAQDVEITVPWAKNATPTSNNSGFTAQGPWGATSAKVNYTDGTVYYENGEEV